MAKKKNVNALGVCYARYSSHNQKDASIEQQVEACRKRAKELNITLIESYEDRAISGKTDKRPAFQRMMKDAEKGKFKYVLSWKSNRIGRNMLEAMMNESRLQSYGIKVRYCEEDFDDTAAGRFALRSMMNVNQFYAENMAEDIKRGLRDNAMKCKVTNGRLPFGYKADINKNWVVDTPKDEIIREIYERVADGEPFADIFADLNKRGIKNSIGRDWGRSSFNKLLTNERYRGIYIYGDIRIEDGIPRIVSDELFFRVQEALRMKKHPRGQVRAYGDYLLTGKLYCGHCNSPMTGLSGTSKSGELHYYYVCQKKRKEHTCQKANIRRDDIELTVAKAIQSVLQDDVIEWIADSTIKYFDDLSKSSNIEILEDELSENKKAINNIMHAIEQGIITPTTKERLLALETEQQKITVKIADAKANILTVSKSDMIAGLEMFRDGDINDKKYQSDLFETFLVAAYVYDDNVKLCFSFTGDKNTATVPIKDIEQAEWGEKSEHSQCSSELPLAPPF